MLKRRLWKVYVVMKILIRSNWLSYNKKPILHTIEQRNRSRKKDHYQEREDQSKKS